MTFCDPSGRPLSSVSAIRGTVPARPSGSRGTTMVAPRRLGRHPVERLGCRPLKSFDYWLQTARIDAAAPFVPDGARVLDIGAADGVLFRRLGDRIAGGVGIDPDAPRTVLGNVRLVPGKFPDDLDSGETFDVVTALAVVEHLDD